MKFVLDACVLFPTVLREILADVAAAGQFQPVWSQRILDEWRHAADRQGIPAGVEIALLCDRFPAAMVAGQGGAEGLDLPDPADRHVLETAMAAQANGIVTANLRDFPHAALAAVGQRAIHPDEFLRDLYLARPDPVLDAIAATERRAARAGGVLSRKDLMRRARLPRLAKALQRTAAEMGPETGHEMGPEMATRMRHEATPNAPHQINRQTPRHMTRATGHETGHKTGPAPGLGMDPDTGAE